MSKSHTPIFQSAIVPDVDAGHVLDDDAPTPDEAATIVQAVPLSHDAMIQQIDSMANCKPKPLTWKELPNCGLLVVQNHTWLPSHPRDLPPSCCDGLDNGSAAQFCMLFNASDTNRARRRWALLTLRSSVVILSGIRPQDRPVDPAAFPPCVQAGLTLVEASSRANDANARRHKLALVPRQWSIALRRPDCIDDPKLSEEGGAV